MSGQQLPGVNYGGQQQQNGNQQQNGQQPVFVGGQPMPGMVSGLQSGMYPAPLPYQGMPSGAIPVINYQQASHANLVPIGQPVSNPNQLFAPAQLPSYFAQQMSVTNPGQLPGAGASNPFVALASPSGNQDLRGQGFQSHQQGRQGLTGPPAPSPLKPDGRHNSRYNDNVPKHGHEYQQQTHEYQQQGRYANHNAHHDQARRHHEQAQRGGRGGRRKNGQNRQRQDQWQSHGQNFNQQGNRNRNNRNRGSHNRGGSRQNQRYDNYQGDPQWEQQQRSASQPALHNRRGGRQGQDNRPQNAADRRQGWKKQPRDVRLQSVESSVGRSDMSVGSTRGSTGRRSQKSGQKSRRRQDDEKSNYSAGASMSSLSVFEPPEEPVHQEKTYGVLKFFKPGSRYGWIAHDSGVDVYVAARELKNIPKEKLKPGLLLELTLIPGKPKPKAANVAMTDRTLFAEYLTEEEVIAGIRQNLLFEGVLRVSRFNQQRGFVNAEGRLYQVINIPEHSLQISGKVAQNRAFFMQRVIVALQDASTWKSFHDVSEDVTNLKKRIEVLDPDFEVPSPLPSAGADGIPVIFHPNDVKDYQPKGRVVAVVSPQERVPAEDVRFDGPRPPMKENGTLAIPRQVLYQGYSRTVVAVEGNGETLVLEDLVHATGTLAFDNDMKVMFTPQDGRYPCAECAVSDEQMDELRKYPLRLTGNLDDPEDPDTPRWLYHVRYNKWLMHMHNPTCVLMKPVGAAFDLQAETICTMIDQQILHGGPYGDHFPDPVLDQVRAISEAYKARGGQLDPEERNARRDLTSWNVFSIDPPHSMDLDDALSLQPKDGHPGVFVLGVHIADPSYYVRPGTPLDNEAKRRATTCYMVQRSVPMIPRPLSEGLCSLHPHVERYAVSCIVDVDSSGNPVSEPWFGRTVICNKARFDYGTAQDVLDGTFDRKTADERNPLLQLHMTPPKVLDDVVKNIAAMDKMAKMMRSRRKGAAGALLHEHEELGFTGKSVTLHRAKLQFQCKFDSGERFRGNAEPQNACNYEIKDANKLIEEFMLLANTLTGKHLLRYVGPRAFLRRHKKPNPTFADRQKTLIQWKYEKQLRGKEFDITRSESLALVLDEIDKIDSSIRSLVEMVLMKAFFEADYLAVDKRPQEDFYHYGLGCMNYTHFTSPIRRYADVVVHRLLLESLTGSTFEVIADSVKSRFSPNMGDVAQEHKVFREGDKISCDLYLHEKGWIKTTDGDFIPVVERPGLEDSPPVVQPVQLWRNASVEIYLDDGPERGLLKQEVSEGMWSVMVESSGALVEASVDEIRNLEVSDLEALHSQAQRCNKMNTAARLSSERCSQIFLAKLIHEKCKTGFPLRLKGSVGDMAKQSFHFALVEIGVEFQRYKLDDCRGTDNLNCNASIEGEFPDGVLTLCFGDDDNKTTMETRIFDKRWVEVRAKIGPPCCVDFVFLSQEQTDQMEELTKTDPTHPFFTVGLGDAGDETIEGNPPVQESIH